MTSDSQRPQAAIERALVGGGFAGQSLAGSRCVASLRGVAVNLRPRRLSSPASGVGLWGLKSVWGRGHIVAEEEGKRNVRGCQD